MNRLRGKRAIVTGGATGIGSACVERMAGEGASVAIFDVLEGEGRLQADDLSTRRGDVTCWRVDVTSEQAVRDAIDAAAARLGGLDILVNNAGVIEPISEVATSDPKVWANNITINLIGAYNVVRAILPDMLAKGGGTIVNVSSGAAYRPLEGWSAYCAGKAGLAMLTRSIELETKGKGIRVFGFSPGTIDTEMQVKIRASGMNMISQIPRANLSPVEHAVRGLVHLCTKASDDLIGQDASMRDDAFRGRIGLAS
jgi:3-oxoacyl-[acyl-carrier protein] reductase